MLVDGQGGKTDDITRGTVEEVLVDDNRHVTAGQPLLKLERLLIQPNESSNVQDFVRISSLFGSS
ncbi:MAG: hypothetical protein WB586_22465 [Chthoniobacterales bacterium]